MRPQSETSSPPAQAPGWFSKNWKWLVGLGCLMPTLCCGGVMVVSALMPPEDNAAEVTCGTPGPAGVECDVHRSAGETAFKACWDLEITCTNAGVMVGSSCAKMPAGETDVTVNLPPDVFSNQAGCDEPANGAVKNLVVTTLQ